MKIINDDSRVVTKLETSLTDDARVVTYNRHMFIEQATDHLSLFIINKNTNITLVWKYLPGTKHTSLFCPFEVMKKKMFCEQMPGA